MTFGLSILMLAGAAISIAMAYFVGHALAAHSTTAALLGAAALGVGAVLLALYLRLGSRLPSESSD